jgi:hypothetical protein
MRNLTGWRVRLLLKLAQPCSMSENALAFLSKTAWLSGPSRPARLALLIFNHHERTYAEMPSLGVSWERLIDIMLAHVSVGMSSSELATCGRSLPSSAAPSPLDGLIYSWRTLAQKHGCSTVRVDQCLCDARNRYADDVSGLSPQQFPLSGKIQKQTSGAITNVPVSGCSAAALTCKGRAPPIRRRCTSDVRFAFADPCSKRALFGSAYDLVTGHTWTSS